MLKACCDCIAAGIREDRDAYGRQSNGNTLRSLLRPEANKETEKMFVLPRQLNIGDQINITGVISNDSQWFSIGLIMDSNGPDYSNIVAQLELNFPSDNNEEKTIIKTIHNGQKYVENVEMSPTNLFPDYHPGAQNVTFTTSIKIGPQTDFYMNDSYLKEVYLKHNIADMNYLIVNGDILKIDKLEFLFAS